MKKAVAIPILFLCIHTIAQTSFSMRIGYSTETKDALIAPALNYTFKAITVGAEMMVNTRDDAPVNFGLKASYQYSFVEIGGGYYYQLYSTDAYDKDKNGFATSVFAAAHWKVFFIEAEYLKEPKFSFGLRTNL
jgi:hypothetical protein